MGKRQHQKDKMYLTCTEWTTLYGGKKAAAAARTSRSEFKRLPFYCCSISLQPVEHPLCTREGLVFDLMSIVPYLKKYGHNPVTGKPLDAKQLIKLKFHKNADDKYHCPVTYKVFNENSHIVANGKTGNVYSYEAVEKLNIVPKHYKDLLNDEPFKRDDIIHIQDPTKLEKFDISTFHHLKHRLKAEEEDEKARKDPNYHLRTVNTETRAALEGLYKEYKAPEKQEEAKQKATARNAAHYSSGLVAQSFTSTTWIPVTENEAAILDRDTVRYGMVKKKGYVRLHTSVGDLNIELHCDLVPKTCENFMILCRTGYYNRTIFHRMIKHFMIQGGDPTATGKGGESAWGKPFKDEFKCNLTHSGRGVLSMANSGTDTNGSQFFITFRSCTHLDNKHSVFGRVVGGAEVLNIMEKVETDEHDKPLEDITINASSVFVDPYEEVDDKLREEEEEDEDDTSEATKPPEKVPAKPLKAYHSGVGKYISQPSSSSQSSADVGPLPATGSKRPSSSDGGESKKHPKMTAGSKQKGRFGDFSGW